MSELERRALNHEVARFTRRNELTLKEISSATVPASLAWVLGSNGFVVAAAGAGVAALAAAGFVLATRRPKMVTVIQEDWRSTDYSTLQKLAYFSPILIFPTAVTAGWADLGLELPAALMVILAVVACMVSLTFSIYGPISSNRRMGRRRANEILRHSSLDGVTEPALRAATDHSSIVAAMLSVGAVDELWITNKRLSRLLGKNVEDYMDQLLELESTGVVKIRKIGLQVSPPHWTITLTAAGVRVLKELNYR